MNVLAINSGSSSVKFGSYDIFLDSFHDEPRVTEEFSQTFSQQQQGSSPQEVFSRIKSLLSETSLAAPAAIGHRLVHGGPTLRQHCLIDESVLQALDQATVFAPLHMPDSIMLIRESQLQFPGIKQVACFDTTFHATLPAVASTFPIAHELQGVGVHRYGFHGLSCESIVYQLQKSMAHSFPKRLIIAHIGNGVSVTAILDGKSIDTSMGLTPSGGVMMGTRSGDLDPGLLFYLMRENQFDVGMIEQLMSHQSGLLGFKC
jgi:acetate kinase